MRLTNDARAASTTSTWVNYNDYVVSDGQESSSPDAMENEEPATILDLSFAALNKTEKDKPFELSSPSIKPNDNKSDIVDLSGKLTRLLVSSKSKEEVMSVLTQAYKNLGDVLQAAASGDETAMKVMRRLHKLIRRANRKIRDLTKEDDIRTRQKRAEKEQIEQLAKQLEDELKLKIAQRRQRERRYLNDVNQKDDKKRDKADAMSISALEARIKSLEFAYNVTLSSVDSAAAPAEAGSGAGGGFADAGLSGPEDESDIDIDE